MKEKNLKNTIENQTLEQKPFKVPKLSYLRPKLKEQGDVEKVTLQGFFGTFSP